MHEFAKRVVVQAATYSPTWLSSTIGAGGFNFSVRYGKRWYPDAIATFILPAGIFESLNDLKPSHRYKVKEKIAYCKSCFSFLEEKVLSGD